MNKENASGIGKYQEAILKVINKEEPRIHFKGIKLTKDGFLEATDGKLLLRIPCEEISREELPTEIKPTENKDMWLSNSLVEKARKNANSKAQIEMLKNVYVEEDDTHIILSSFDLDNKVEIKENKKQGEENLKAYPDTERVLKCNEENVDVKVSFSVKSLKKIIDTVEKMEDKYENAITFFFNSREPSKYPVRFIFDFGDRGEKKGIGVVMPLKERDDHSIKKYQELVAKKEE